MAADGSIAEVDDTSTPGSSIRYSSYQYLGQFSRRQFDSGSNLISDVRVSLTTVSGGARLKPQFYTPIALNRVNQLRMVIGAENSVYESFNQGDTVREIGPGIRANGSGHDTIAYGASDNPDVLYVGAGSSLFIRVAAHPAPLTESVAYRGGVVLGVANDRQYGRYAVAIDPMQVYRTEDTGSSWTDVTDNLLALDPGLLKSVEIISGPPAFIVAGAQKGVFFRPLSDPGHWARLGNGLPKVPVYHLEYDNQDQILLAGTLGRGAWTLAAERPVPQTLAMLVNTSFSPVPGVATTDEDGPPSSGVTISDGVVYDPRRDAVYIMESKGGISAVGTTNGEKLWTNDAADRPLAVIGERVVGQVDAPETRNSLGLRVLNAVTGEKLVEGAQELPGAFTPAVDETLEGRLQIAAQPAGDEVMVSWEFKARPVRALPPGADDPAPGVAAGAPQESPERVGATSGIFTMSLSSGDTKSLNLAVPSTPTLEGDWAAQPNATVPDVAGDQFLSADGRHIAVSRMSGSAEITEKYTIEVYDRATKERLGQFSSSMAAPPILVINEQRVLWVSDAFSSRSSAEEQLKREPRKVRCMSLKDRSLKWDTEVRDTTYQGKFPS